MLGPCTSWLCSSGPRSAELSLSGCRRGILPRSGQTGSRGLDEEVDRGAELRDALELGDRQLAATCAEADDHRDAFVAGEAVLLGSMAVADFQRAAPSQALVRSMEGKPFLVDPKLSAHRPGA